MGGPHRPLAGRSKAAILDVLTTHIREEMTLEEVARRAHVPVRTTEDRLRQLRRDKQAFSRRAVTLFGRPLLWSRVAI
jgi:transcriptional regulator GlxA family with amidase domain